jgi:uncharacterized protein Yka (UPF0111/DUF47 family)
MKNRELMIRNVEKLEGGIRKLRMLISRGAQLQEFIEETKRLEDVTDDLKSMIEREPFAPNEINSRANF